MQYQVRFQVGDPDIVNGEWPWNHFMPREIACNCERHTSVLDLHVANIHAMNCLEKLRNMTGPLTIISGYRCPYHNRQVGGADNSLHMQGRAFDISFEDLEITSIRTLAKVVHNATVAGFTGFGIYEASEFLHIDTGPTRFWEQAGSFFDDFNM